MACNVGTFCSYVPVTGAVSPSVVPEFYGDFILVNGKTWPVLKVEPRKYRFRVLNGSNSRFYNMRFRWTDTSGTSNVTRNARFHQIGTDGGLLNAPVALKQLLLGPAERADIVIDFSIPKFRNKTIFVRNNARSPYPDGDPVTGGASRVMAFRVVKPLNTAKPKVNLPAKLRKTKIPKLTKTPSAPIRRLVLVENTDSLGRLEPLLGTAKAGGLKWSDPITEKPRLGTNEVWTVINTTPDAHPIHQHLVQFQIIDRQKYNTNAFVVGKPGTLSFVGARKPPPAKEKGWKNTAIMYPGEVTRVIANYDLIGEYVWHCHILEHEDHEMMRPFRVIR